MVNGIREDLMPVCQCGRLDVFPHIYLFKNEIDKLTPSQL